MPYHTPEVSPNLDPNLSATSAFGTNVGDAILEQTDVEFTAAPELDAENNEGGTFGLPCNVGGIDRLIRIGVGAAAVGTAAFAPLPRAWRIGLAAVGATALLSGFLRYCPANQMLGRNTCGS